jgi:hypothetical protein
MDAGGSSQSDRAGLNLMPSSIYRYLYVASPLAV